MCDANLQDCILLHVNLQSNFLSGLMNVSGKWSIHGRIAGVQSASECSSWQVSGTIKLCKI